MDNDDIIQDDGPDVTGNDLDTFDDGRDSFEGDNIEDEAPEADADAGEPAAKDDDLPEPPNEEANDSALSAALLLFGQVGITEQDRAMALAQFGDFSELEARAMQFRGAKQQQALAALSLMKDAWQRFDQADKIAAVRAEREMDIEAGGDWKGLKAWAEKAGDDSEKELMKAALAEGPTARKLLVRYLSAMRQQVEGQTKPAPSISRKSEPGKQPARRSGPMTDEEFSSKTLELSRRFGAEYHQTPQYRQLAQAWLATQR